jgi:hypothetical protein
MPDQDPLLSVAREFWPVVGHRRVEIQLPSILKHQRAQEGHRLGGRGDLDDGVFFPGPSFFGVLVSRPDVDHKLTFDRRRE